MALAGGAGGIASDLADFAAHIRAEFELGQSAQKLIERSIGRSRVVMLGELTHGDGTSFALKAAIVKHLHSKLGFEVLIWESGLYDCAVMDRAIGGSDPLEGVAGQGVFDHWSQSSDSFPIFEYARQSHSSGRPLRMAGFDIQPSGSASNGMLVEMIEWFGNTLSGKAKADVERRIADIRAANQESFPRAYREALKIPSILLNEYQKRRRDLDAQWGAERGFRVQALASSAKYEEMMAMVGSTTLDPSAYNLRERANAENLLFLIRQYYKGKKVIVWAHNVHLFKGLPGDGAGVKRKPIGRALDSMGRIVTATLGADVCSIGVMASRGSWSWRGGAPIEFAKPAEGSIETRLESSGLGPLAYISMRELPKGHRLRLPLPGVIDRQNPWELTTIWPDGWDGLLYVAEMRPRAPLPRPNEPEGKVVPQAGLEPATQGFSVLCSTN